jgi:isoquinoline 1-oxidoreductase subunit alpha
MNKKTKSDHVKKISLKVNGVAHTFTGNGQMPLVWYLRDELLLTGTKVGCGKGLCGACTVHIDGRAERSCLTEMRNIEGKSVVTIEALSARGDHPLQKAWAACDVPQCGYCQSGQLMQAAALLQQKPQPNDRDIEDAMQGNICRCGTYQRIRQGIKLASGGHHE